jgi:DNA-binding transcriptional LysR family regulator
MSVPPFASLRAFEAVFRVGGIRKAAEELGLSHTVVSRHIKKLEAWMGGALVLRTGNILVLTEAGRKLHSRVTAAISEIGDAIEEFRGFHRAAPLRLWCVPGLSIQWLAGEIADFERENTHRQVELRSTDTMANLAAHEADADIRYYRDDAKDVPDDRGLQCFEIARPFVQPVASPDLANSLGEAISKRTIFDLPFLHEDNDNEWRAWLTTNGMSVSGKLSGLKCWQAHLLIAAAREGRGIALASRLLVERDIVDGRLVPLNIPGTEPIALGAYILAAREDRWSDTTLVALRHRLRAHAKPYLRWQV